MKKAIKRDYLKRTIIKLAKIEAMTEANTTCSFLGYQHKEPASVKRLRKF